MLEPAIVTRAGFDFTIVVESPQGAGEAQSQRGEDVGRMLHCEGLLVEAKGAANKEESSFTISHAHPRQTTLNDVSLKEVRRREVTSEDHKGRQRHVNQEEGL